MPQVYQQELQLAPLLILREQVCPPPVSVCLSIWLAGWLAVYLRKAMPAQGGTGAFRYWSAQALGVIAVSPREVMRRGSHRASSTAAGCESKSALEVYPPCRLWPARVWNIP